MEQEPARAFPDPWHDPDFSPRQVVGRKSERGSTSGGSWNAAIVAELASWGSKQVRAHGLGSYIAEATLAGNYHHIVLGIATMSVFVVAINRLFWRPLYYYAERRFRLS